MPQPHVDGHHLARRLWFRARRILGWTAKYLLQYRMPRLPEPKLAFGIDVGRRQFVFPAELGFRGDEIKPGHHFNGVSEGPGHSANVGRQLAKNAANLAV